MFGNHLFRSLVAIVAFALLATAAQAEVIMPWVTVGNPGNADDVQPQGTFGGVAYTYFISEHEVTNSQYTEFLNTVADTDTNNLYNSSMGSNVRGGITRSGTNGSYTYSTRTNMGNKPVNYVSFFDAMRFVNWLQNGQPTGAQGTGTTEAGVYSIGTGTNETRAASATYVIPSEDEWYKAAYYDPRLAAAGGPPGDDNYWLYPTQSDTAPTIATANSVGDISNPGTNVANYLRGADWNLQDGNVTTVGTAGNTSFYGTFDQGGNVWEWNEAVISSSFRGLRGGRWDGNSNSLAASLRSSAGPGLESNNIGFRVASIPEPSTAVLGIVGMLCMLCWLRRRRAT